MHPFEKQKNMYPSSNCPILVTEILSYRLTCSQITFTKYNFINIRNTVSLRVFCHHCFFLHFADGLIQGSIFVKQRYAQFKLVITTKKKELKTSVKDLLSTNLKSIFSVLSSLTSSICRNIWKNFYTPYKVYLTPASRSCQ